MQKRHVNLRSLLIVATPFVSDKYSRTLINIRRNSEGGRVSRREALCERKREIDGESTQVCERVTKIWGKVKEGGVTERQRKRNL